MRHELLLHPDSPCEALRSVAVEVSRGGGLNLRYVVTGDLAQLKRGAPQTPERADDLWKSTCFEAFLRTPVEDSYLEFNFAPSRQWAAYCFRHYREGMHDLVIAPPAISLTEGNGALVLEAQLDPADAAALPRNSIWQLGLSAIIEETNGRKSYWALRHPPGKPDFHHPDCFALELPPPSPAR